MPKPSLVIILGEDKRHQQLIFRYLRRLGLETHQMRFRGSPSGDGSGEQLVRDQFPIEVAEYRRRQANNETKLIVVTDADRLSVQERLSTLDRILQESRADSIRPETEQIARLTPKRNIETWILCLNSILVIDGDPLDEDTDYKKKRTDWSELIRPAAEALFAWTREHAQIPEACLRSLRLGVVELRQLNFT
jgi:DNA polymerase III psi subunit